MSDWTKKIRLAILSLMMLGFVLFPVSRTIAADYGLGEAAGAAGIKGYFSQTDPLIIVGNVIAVVLSLLGIIFFILIMYAGFRWMTAFGNPDRAEKSKDMLETAAIGLLIILAAYAIAKFVFSALGIA